MNLELHDLTEDQREVYAAVKLLVNEFADVVPPVAMVAIFSQLIGNILAGTNHRLDPDEQSHLVARNVRHGFEQMKCFIEEKEGGHC